MPIQAHGIVSNFSKQKEEEGHLAQVGGWWQGWYVCPQQALKALQGYSHVLCSSLGAEQRQCGLEGTEGLAVRQALCPTSTQALANHLSSLNLTFPDCEMTNQPEWSGAPWKCFLLHGGRKWKMVQNMGVDCLT